MNHSPAMIPGNAKASSTAVLCHHAFQATRQSPLLPQTMRGVTSVKQKRTNASSKFRFTPRGYNDAPQV